MAQSAPDVQATRQTAFGVSGEVAYDSNVGHVSGARGATRGIKPEDELFRPRANFTFVEPIGRQALFLEGTAGYDFHRLNKQLDRANVDLTGGGLVVTGICRTTLYGGYTASQSDPQDVPGPTARNLLTNTSEGVAVGCGTPTGLTGQFSYRHSDASNSNSAQATADHTVNAVTGSVGYGNASLGSLSLVGSHSQSDFPNRVLFGGTPNGGGFTSESLGVSYQKAFGSRIKASVSAGGSKVNREAAPVGVPRSSSGLNYSASVEYKIGQRIDLTAVGSRAYVPSNRAGKLYELVTHTELSGVYHLGSRLDFTAGVLAEQSEANADTSIPTKVPTSFHKTGVYGTAAYHQNQHTSLVLDVRHESKTTDLPDFDYSDNRVSLTLAMSF
jgi:hypothetical protein